MPNRLGMLDTAWLHLERRTNPMMVTGVLWFDRPLEIEALQQVLEERLVAAYPRFSQRVVDPVGPVPARWVPEEAFHIDDHLHHVALPEPGGKAALQELVGDLASTQLDLRISPWQFHLVDGYNGGSALIGRIHHCIADGIALARVLFGLTDGTGQLSAAHPAVRRRRWLGVPARVLQATAHTVEALADTLGDPQKLAEILDLGAEGAREIAYLLALPPDADTPLRRPLGVRKHCGWADPIPLDEVKAVGKAFGCTVNDVLVSAMAGALGEHLRDAGSPVDRIRVFVPVNLRPLDEPVPRELGNHFSLVVLPLPVGETDPLQRLRAVHAEMDRLKGSAEIAVAYALFAAMGATPARIENGLVDYLSKKGSAVFTNVPGPRRQVTLAGVPVSGVMVWVPQSGPLGLGLSIFSYNGQVTVGVAADANCLDDPQGLADRFAVAFGQLRQRAMARSAV